jgi:hypothetical protein
MNFRRILKAPLHRSVPVSHYVRDITLFNQDIASVYHIVAIHMI